MNMYLPWKPYLAVFAASSVFLGLFLGFAAPILRSRLSADKDFKRRESSLCTQFFLVATTASGSPIKGKVVILPAQHQVVNQRYLSERLPRYDRSISQENFKNAPIGKSGLALAYGGSPIYLDNSVLKAFFLVAGIADTVVVPGEQVGSYSYPYKLLLQWSSRHELLQIRECL